MKDDCWHLSRLKADSSHIVVSLGDPGLTIDVWQAHLTLLVQLPVEADRVLQVVLVRRVVEEPFEQITVRNQNIQKTKKRPQSAAIIARGAPVPDVESRLKYNRNYQAPRKKKIVIKVKLGLCLLMI